MSNASFEDKIQKLSPLQKAAYALKKIDAKLNDILHEPIAIIGMGCSFPGGATTPEKFWELLHEGKSAREEIPVERWDVNNYYHPDRDAVGKMVTRHGHFIRAVDQFDPEFFGISPREAIAIDPQHRLLLEVSWQALERAGQKVERLSAASVGVFVGNDGHDYEHIIQEYLHQESDSSLWTYTGTGNSISSAAGRLAYTFGFTGPTVTIDTACSSSLVAIHQACNSIRLGECQIAIAGGVKLHLTPESYIFTSQVGMLSPDGLCKTFDISADGYARGEGCGMVVLKRLSQAQEDKDPILALIQGSAVNHNGASSSLTVPNGQSQQKLIKQALKQARVDPAEISYLEAHGTGTSLGDPIEVNAAIAVLGENRTPAEPLWIGSVKTNIGHLESAAGVSALIKVVLSMQYQQLPPHLHLQDPNPKINWQTWLKVPQVLTPWTALKKKLAGVSSFGFTGTNAHIIVGEAPTVISRSIREYERPVHLLQLSAKNDLTLAELAQLYSKYLAAHPEQDLGDICFTANNSRLSHNHRLVVVASNREELQRKLNAVGTGSQLLSVARGEVSGSQSAKVVMLFTGEGSQYIDMGRELYSSQPVFRKILEQCEDIVRSYLEKPLIEVLYPQQEARSRVSSVLDETKYTQVALFAIEYALFKLWQSWGVQPDIVMGYGIGEYVAATVAGVFSLENGLKLVANRGRLMQQLHIGGEMLAVMASEEKINQLIAPYTEKVAIAAINGLENIVISGDAIFIGIIKTTLESEGIKTQQLQTSQAFNSPSMNSMLAEFEAVANQITYNQPEIPLVSNVTGAKAAKSIASAKYWVNHVCQPVKFAQSIETLHQEGYEIFLEIGPNPILLGMGRQCLPLGVGVWLPSMHFGCGDSRQMLQSLGELYIRGVKIDWLGFDQDYALTKVVLPTYPFQRKRYWIDIKNRYKEQYPSKNKDLHPLLGQRLYSALQKNQIQFEALIGESKPAYLNHHKVFGTALFPTTAYLEIALAAGYDQFKTLNLVVEDLVIDRGLILLEGELKTVQSIFTPSDNQTYQFQIFTRQEQYNQDSLLWILHASGKIKLSEIDCIKVAEDLEKHQIQCNNRVDVREHYRKYRQIGIDYGNSFQCIQELWRGNNQAFAKIKLHQDLTTETTKYLLHPALLDAALQLIGYIFLEAENGQTYLPVEVKQLKVYRRSELSILAYASVTDSLVESKEGLNAQVMLVSEDGDIIATVKGIRVKKVTLQTLLKSEPESVKNWLYKVEWKTQNLSNQSLKNNENFIKQVSSLPKVWLIFADKRGIAKHLSIHLRSKGDICIVVIAGEKYQRKSPVEFTINPHSSEEFKQLISNITNQFPSIYGIIQCWMSEAFLSNYITYKEVEDLSQLGCGSTLSLIQALAKGGLSPSPRLWLVTQGTQPIPGKNLYVTGVAQSSLWGMGKVIALEHPELKCVQVDLDPNASVEQQAQALWEEFWLEDDAESQVAIREQDRYVARLIPYHHEQNTTAQKLSQILQYQGHIDDSSHKVLSFNEDASYLITGGLGGLGLLVARWMVKHGARNIVLLGRSGVKNHLYNQLKELEESGANIVIYKSDVSDFNSIAQVILEIEQSLPPLRGVIHAAGLLADGILQHQSWEKFSQVMAPKVQGAWNLHNLTLHKDLDFFILFSSVASLFGSPGQANYSAANAFLDTLAHYRHSLGLPGLSINWGIVSEIGIAVKGEIDGRLKGKGIESLLPQQVLESLEMLIDHYSGSIGVVPIRWSEFIKYSSGSLFFSELVKIHEQKSFSHPVQKERNRQFLAEWKTVSQIDKEELMIIYIQNKISQILKLSHSQVIDVQQQLNTIGLDSLMAVELRNILKTELTVDIPLVKFIEDINIFSLSQEIIRQLEQLDEIKKIDSKENRDIALLENTNNNHWIEGEL
jgi:acyl transferase domain-containing protein/acyl carrier protein